MKNMRTPKEALYKESKILYARQMYFLSVAIKH